MIRTIVAKLVRAIIGQPKEKEIALQKRALQKELQAAGHSRKQAMRIVFERYREQA